MAQRVCTFDSLSNGQVISWIFTQFSQIFSAATKCVKIELHTGYTGMDQTDEQTYGRQRRYGMSRCLDFKSGHLFYLFISTSITITTLEPRHDKTNKIAVRLLKTQISLGIRPVWSESSLSAWRKLGSLATHWAHSEDSDQTGRMPRLIWVFAGRTAISLVLSCRGSLHAGLHEKLCSSVL